MSYDLPTMEQVRATPWNGLRAASLFAGCGGSSLGYRMAGFRVAYANDLDDNARRVYALNASPRTVVDGTDVRTVAGGTILQAVAEDGGAELDLLDGSPPCQAFSMAGQRRMDDPRADLFYEFNRLVREVRPRSFVAENVPGLARGHGLGHLTRVLGELKEAGYRVRRHLIDASWLGVPQARERLVIIGFRRDLRIDPALGFPRPRRRTTLHDALPRVGHFAPARTVMTGGLDQRFRVREDGRPGTRALTVSEVRRVCSFPADFRMEGSTSDQMRRLGNAVPPLMARAWAERVREALLVTRA